jgi:hypothetical protein
MTKKTVFLKRKPCLKQMSIEQICRINRESATVQEANCQENMFSLDLITYSVVRVSLALERSPLNGPTESGTLRTMMRTRIQSCSECLRYTVSFV